jgi:hypothetical protein
MATLNDSAVLDSACGGPMCIGFTARNSCNCLMM